MGAPELFDRVVGKDKDGQPVKFSVSKTFTKVLLIGTLAGLGDERRGQPGSFLRTRLFRGRRWHFGL